MPLHRREFCRLSLGLLAAGLAGPLAAAPRSRSQRLRIGSQTNTWGAPIKDYDQLLRILDALKQLGYQGFETNYMSLNAQAARAADCRRAFESRRIHYVAPHTGAKLHDGDEKEAEDLRRIAGYSAQMGASHFIVSGRRLPHPDGKLDLNTVHTKAEALNQFGRFCRQEGLKLCYHNHVQEFQDEPWEMSFLLRETDPALVWLNYDVGNPYGHGPDAGSFSAENFRRIAIYHIKDVAPGEGGKMVATDLGAGKVDLKAVVAPVLNSDWEGWLVVEREGSYPKPAEHPEELLRQCRTYLKQITKV